ncbi:MAG: DUF2336 domain-containing protein [Xanthobacteraceae bacterium]
MRTNNSIIAELEDAIKNGSQERRVETLRRVTDLFLTGADRFNDEQIKVFDDVLGHLIARIETKALAELSERLAPIANAPIDVIQRLARDEEVAVAGPILLHSERLTENDLIEISMTKSQGHLLAISGRTQIGEAVTDVLLDRGGRAVTHKLAQNSGAHFSEVGFAKLVKGAEADESLAEELGLRLDIPLPLFRELLLKATDAVRARLLAKAPPETRDEIQRVLATISNEVCRQAATPRDFVSAQRVVNAMRESGELDEATILQFVQENKSEEMIVAVSLLCSTSLKIIERIMQDTHGDGILIACKAAELHWPTVAAIMKCRYSQYSISDQELARVKTDFIRLSKTTAQRVLRFWQARDAPSNMIGGSDTTSR